MVSLQGGYDYSPAMTFEDQAADQDGTYLFPWTAYVGELFFSQSSY